MKLTKAQRAKAKRAVLGDLPSTTSLHFGRYMDTSISYGEPKHRECLRLLSVAIAAVRKDRGAKR